MQTRSNNYWHAALAGLTVFSVGTTGCNMFGGIDHPGEAQDKYTAAVALANAGLCSDAVDLLSTIFNPSDDVSVALGWAQLCVGGATAGNIATSLYKFSSGSSDVTSVGVLARTMLPMTGDKSNALQKAVDAFNVIQDSSRKSVEVAIGDFAQAAGILANQSGNNSVASLTQTDIAPAGCEIDSANCAATTVACTATPGMSDSAVNSFISSINAAAQSLQLSGSSSLTALALALKLGLAVGNPGRCYIYNSVIPNP